MVAYGSPDATCIPEDAVMVGPRWVADENLGPCTTAASHLQCN
jgi:hypothetical protein